jgi:hypothetical protein
LHPVASPAITVGGRYKLLELGTMAAGLPLKKVRPRLLSRKEFTGTFAELRGGLMLRTTGAQLQWEPMGGVRSGPDWLATWPSGGVLAAEVKCPRMSVREEQRWQLVNAFLFEFMRRICDPPLSVDTGAWLTICPREKVLAAKTDLGSPDLVAIRARAGEAAEAVRCNMPRPTVCGRFAAGPSCDFEVTLTRR